MSVATQNTGRARSGNLIWSGGRGAIDTARGAGTAAVAMATVATLAPPDFVGCTTKLNKEKR